MSAIFFTGFPGFLGSELLPRILGRDAGSHAICLVQPKFRALADARAQSLGPLSARVRIVEGDITAPLTSIDVSEVREVYHFAAVYDLSVGRDLAIKVNLDGTRHLLDLAARAPALERMHYVSTCYVSGRHAGRFGEDDLEVGQRFNNYYEETKYLAEREVRVRMKAGLPVTIYRPSVVVGDSRTGATQKFDGPYFVLQWLLRQPRVAVLPVVGRPSKFRFNVVPRDFVIDAMDHLSSRTDTKGACYALADPAPLTVDATIRVLGAAAGRRVLRVPLPRAVAKAAISYVPGVYRLMRIPAEAVDYFVHPTEYDTSRATAALAAAGIRPAGLKEYAGRMVDFVRAHPEVGSQAMV